MRLVFEPRAAAPMPQAELVNDAARAHQPRELGADQPDDGRRRRPADAEEPARSCSASGSASAPRRSSAARAIGSARSPSGSTSSKGASSCCSHIDEVIAIIRAADEPKAALIERFALSERQADDILDIRLRQLARLEAIRIEQELKELRAESAKLNEILASPAALKRTVIREIEADAKAHGDERRTLIEAQKRAVAEVRVVDEPVTVVVSMKGWVRALKSHEVDAAPARVQGRRRAVRHVRLPQRRHAARLRQQRARLLGRRSPACRAVAATAAVTSLIDLEAGTQPAHYFAGAASRGAAARRHRRLRPARARRRPRLAPARRQGLPRPRGRREAAAAGDRRRRRRIARRLPDARRAPARLRRSTSSSCRATAGAA